MVCDPPPQESTYNDYEHIAMKQPLEHEIPISLPTLMPILPSSPKSKGKIEKHVFKPIMSKNLFFEELLKKYGTI